MELIKVHASVMGASHKRKTNPICQDANLVKNLDDKTIVAAVADGHGDSKCRFSDRGAKKATECFFHMIKRYYEDAKGNHDELIRRLRSVETLEFVRTFQGIWKDKVDKSYAQLRRRYVDLAEKKDADYELFGTTFLGIVVASDFVFAIQIGDGDISYITAEGCQSVIEADKFLGTETYSLSDRKPWKHAKVFFRRADYDAVPSIFMLTSDGFANSYKDDTQYKVACKDYFDTICKYGEKAVQSNLEEWLNQTSEEGCGDDITLVAIGWIKDTRNQIPEKD